MRLPLLLLSFLGAVSGQSSSGCSAQVQTGQVLVTQLSPPACQADPCLDACATLYTSSFQPVAGLGAVTDFKLSIDAGYSPRPGCVHGHFTNVFALSGPM